MLYVCFLSLFVFLFIGGCFVKITVNGEETTLEKQVTVEELLVVTKAQTPEYVTVQINDEFIDRENFASTLVRDGDAVEYLYFMGGGRL